ncbi:MAG: hypothetical protein R3E62_02815 [Pseudomonadales bacterium]
MKTHIFILLMLFSVGVSSNDEKQILASLNKLQTEINHIGGSDHFVTTVIEKIQTDQCRSLVELVDEESPFAGDLEYFYAKCLYNSRQFGEILSFEIGRFGFHPLGLGDGPPFIPDQTVFLKVRLGGKVLDRGIQVKFKPRKNHFTIYDLEFIYGKAHL